MLKFDHQGHKNSQEQQVGQRAPKAVAFNILQHGHSGLSLKIQGGAFTNRTGIPSRHGSSANFGRRRHRGAQVQQESESSGEGGRNCLKKLVACLLSLGEVGA